MATTKEQYISALQKIAAETGRYPRKSDFSELDVQRIKGFFGPWPWALEAAGLKPSTQEERKAKNRARRERAKQNKTRLSSDRTTMQEKGIEK